VLKFSPQFHTCANQTSFNGFFLLIIYSGGLSNFLYYCALPSGAKPNQGEPSNVLVRFYGQIHGEGALEALLTESVIFTLLSERKLGPKLHGIFPGGRLEEFIAVISAFCIL
jgi:hypothetical protein